jgi:hypothetical protein
MKRRVALLGLDTARFTNQRTCSDAALNLAAAQACSWDELLAMTGITSPSGNERTQLKARALRLGIDLSHLTDQSQETSNSPTPRPELKTCEMPRRRLLQPGSPCADSPLIAGRVGIVLRSYAKYRVGNAAGLVPHLPGVA